MNTISLIYIIGVVIASVINYNLFIKKEDYITIKDLIIYLTISVSSWLSIIVCIVEYWKEILNYRMYDKNKKNSSSWMMILYY